MTTQRNVLVKENNVFILIDGVPAALQRHRSCILNGRVHTYDSQKDLKKKVLECVLMQLPKNFKPFDCPIEMLIDFYLPIPKSKSKKKQRDLECSPHFRKPDLSNLIKFFEDTFNGVIYKDDSLITYIHSSKINSVEPKTVICIREYQPKMFLKIPEELDVCD